jgi:UDP-N-acetylglucosamine 4,6-dehydratase
MGTDKIIRKTRATGSIEEIRIVKTYLVTGGAGSLGRHICEILINWGHKVRAMDINEAGLAALTGPEYQLTKIYGNIRDYPRVHYAMRGCDTVIHCAAMKNLEITELNVPELNQTNIIGTDNIGRAASDLGLDCAILISSDKAVSPSSAYGATKCLNEESWRFYSRIQTRTRFAIFRSGNFRQSAGNVLEVWQKQAMAGVPLTITDPGMCRYFIDTRKAAEIVCRMPSWVQNGDLVVPKMEKWNMLRLLMTEFPNCAYVTTGKRTGEKLEEVMIKESERIEIETEEYQVIV